jgi:predicted acyl esterase
MNETTLAVEVIEHFVIPTRDGRKLSARVWKPVTTERLPVILEYIPYRKRDVTRYRDEPMHGYFARKGFVAVRLDLAGSGDSEGVLTDEYALQEQEDALDAIDWLSRQDWCSGVVGMIGKSWGGFNCLQIAARRPPALRAIIPVAATDDRFNDDVHFMGGCLLVDGIDWGAVLQTFLPRPPDPALVGDGWQQQPGAALVAQPQHGQVAAQQFSHGRDGKQPESAGKTGPFDGVAHGVPVMYSRRHSSCPLAGTAMIGSGYPRRTP